MTWQVTRKPRKKNYLLYVKKREAARMGDALDVGGIVNVAIAEEPVVPAIPCVAGRGSGAGRFRGGADGWNRSGLRRRLYGSGAPHTGRSISLPANPSISFAATTQGPAIVRLKEKR